MELGYGDENCNDCYWYIFESCTLDLKKLPAKKCSEFSDSERFDFIDI